MNLKSVKMILATLFMCLGFNVAFAAETDLPVKMTHISGTAADVDTSYGEETEAVTGYNKISGDAVNLGQSAWGANNVVFLQVDASGVTGELKNVTLSLEASGSTDSKRNGNIGVGYNTSTWSADLTWNTADRSITTLGSTIVSSSKSATVFGEMTFDITDAFTADDDKVVTILVYNLNAAGNNIKNVKAVATYTVEDQTLVSYSFNDAENPVLTLDGSNADRGTANYDFSRNDSPFLNIWGENNNNGSKLISLATEDITSNGQWTLEFDWAGYSGCNKKGGFTELRDAEGNVILSITDDANWNTTFTLSTGQTITCYPCNKATRISANTASALTPEYWHHITIIGTKNGVSISVQDYDADGNITGYSVKNAKASAENANPAILALRPGSCGSVAIDDLKLVVGDLKIVEYAYTIKYVDQNGEEFKEAVTRTDVEGATLAITDEDKATVVNGKSQYTYVSDDAEGKSLDGEGYVITVTFNKVTVADYVVNFLDAEGNALKDAVTHKNANVGEEVNASAAEQATILIDGKLYQYASGAQAITVAEDESANVINLVFAPVEGIDAYAYKNYEDKTVDWTTKTSGRSTPIIINGANVASREVSYSHVDSTYVTVYDEDGVTPLKNEAGEDSVKLVTETVIDKVETVDFANKTNFLGIDPASTNNNGSVVTAASLGVDEKDFTFEAKIILGASNDQNCAYRLYNYADDAEILLLAPATVGSTDWIVNNNDTISLPNSGTNTGTTIDSYNFHSWYNFKVTVFKGYTFLTVTDEAGNAICENKQITTIANTYGAGKQTWTSGRYYGSFGIDDILVRNVLDTDKPAGFNPVNVTYAFVDEAGETIKEAEVIQLNDGDAIVIRDNYKQAFKVGHYEVTTRTETTPEEVDEEGNVITPAGEIEVSDSTWVDDVKYIYVSDNSEGLTATEGTQVNIVFRAAKTGRLVLRYKTMVDGTATNTNVAVLDSKAEGKNYFEGDEITIFTPLYVWINGTDGKGDTPVLYNGPTKSYPFSFTYTVPQLKETGSTVVYPEQLTVTPATVEETDSLGNVLSTITFFAETEDIEGMTVVNDTYTNIRMSNGKTGSAIGGAVKVTTLAPGQYTITSSTRSGVTVFTINGETVYTIESAGSVTTTTSEVITVNKASDLYIEEQAATTQYNDYVIIKQVGTVEAPSPVQPLFSELVTDGETIYYLYNVETHAFVTGGNNWGTRASGNIEKGNQVKVSANGETYKISDLVGANWNAFDVDGNKDSWVDGQGRAGDGTWVITPNGDNTYAITNTVAGDLKWGIQLDMANSRVQFKTNAAYGYTWAFVSESDYNDYMEVIDKDSINAILAANTPIVEEALIEEYNAANAIALEEMKKIIDGTNVYGEGYDAYVQKYEDYKAKYEANELKEFIVNPAAATGWHASTDYNFLLTPWTIGDKAANNWDASLYINTWSVEGTTDGSNFLVPFFEYWTGDSNSLGENTIATTVTGLEPGKAYDVTVWTRVRMKNGAEGDATGITLQAGDGEAVDACAGEQVGETQFRLMEVKATGNADADGNLVIAFNVAADNNISWLSYKNVQYAAAPIPLIYSDLTADDFKQWDDCGANANVVGPGYGAYNIGVSDGLPYGDGNVDKCRYADLSNAQTLVITVSEGTPRPLFNRDIDNGQAPDHLIDIPNNADQTAKYQTVVDNGDGTQTYTIDIAQIVADYGYAHLHCVKGAYWQNTTVISLQVGLEEGALPVAINTIATSYKNGKYMENGKLIIVRNGIKYNANGVAIK